MDHLSVAAFGLLTTGLTATGIIGWFTLARLSDHAERVLAFQWLGAFGSSICTFMTAMPFLVKEQSWILLLPFLGIWLSLDALHRIGSRSTGKTPELAADVGRATQ